MNSIKKIHFVSYGHAFRSRLAEAYLKYLDRNSRHLEPTSSGIKIEKSINGPIAWYAMKILAQNELVPYMSMDQIRTTQEILENQDLVVFMDDYSFEHCQRHFNYVPKNYLVWNIDYIPPDLVNIYGGVEEDLKIIEKSYQIFKQIKESCQELR